MELLTRLVSADDLSDIDMSYPWVYPGAAVTSLEKNGDKSRKVLLLQILPVLREKICDDLTALSKEFGFTLLVFIQWQVKRKTALMFLTVTFIRMPVALLYLVVQMMNQ